MSQRQSFGLGFFVCVLVALPLLYLGSCADDLTGATGASGQDAAATPNVSIRGGGTITWSKDNDQISFTENIILRDHARGSTWTITPTASPITLSQVNDISYVEVVRDVGVEEEITKTTEVESGSIDLEEGNSVAVTLFERVETDVIYIPWVQKELVTGDEWRFGTALSLYERIVGQAKPRFYGDGLSDARTIVVPATSSAPAIVSIQGKIHVNASDEACVLPTGTDSDSRGGLDNGDIIVTGTPYYLYAIPSEVGRGFDLVASVRDPSNGPLDFDRWSYLGAFSSKINDASIPPFQSKGGVLMSDFWMETENHNENTSYTEKDFQTLPLTAFKAWGLIRHKGSVKDKQGRVTGGGSGYTGTQNALVLLPRSSDLNNNYGLGWVPLFRPQKIYLMTDDMDNEVGFELKGWQEDPMAYK